MSYRLEQNSIINSKLFTNFYNPAPSVTAPALHALICC